MLPKGSKLGSKLRVRREHLAIDKAGVGFVVEPEGSEPTGFRKAGEADIVALFRERHDFNLREMILKPRVDRIHLFDAETGARV